ncbi:MAG: glycosyltransferase family 2 protein [Anaerolineae bacterium]|nr:glycosyltransferase family 2 protein [Thermoflexus sp.]MDW8064576.1 glycosyltransferase family 2 protein [Anaerolineae bacterium]
MKRKKIHLIVQIPSYNEAQTIGSVIREIPRAIPGVDRVKILVVDDGSSDGTGDIARAAGADIVVRHRRNRGLAAALQTGFDVALRLGADLIINLDADGQYDPSEIPQLIAPILQGEADIVIGDRQVAQLAHFPRHKRWLSVLGSTIVRWASGLAIPDATSGFRAYSREAALRLFVLTDFSYTIEHLIQAGKRRLAVIHVPIRARPTPRPSRLHQGIWSFIKRQGATLIRVYASYEPMRAFFYLSAPFWIIGLALFLRLGWLFVAGGFALYGHLQSLIVATLSITLAFLISLFGLLADRIKDNRMLLEEILYHLRELEIRYNRIITLSNKEDQLGGFTKYQIEIRQEGRAPTAKGERDDMD